jgi:hypothetical protein
MDTEDGTAEVGTEEPEPLLVSVLGSGFSAGL